MSKFTVRLYQFSLAIPKLCLKWIRKKPEKVNSILVAHNLLLGDTVMLVPLLSRLRARYPNSRICLLCKKPFIALLKNNPYQITLCAYSPCDLQSVRQIVRQGPFDLAFIPGENRYSWLALAAGSRWITGHKASAFSWKSLPLNEMQKYPQTAMAWSDAIASLVPGPQPESIPWQAEGLTPLSNKRYVVLHVGASTPTRFWPAERWFALAQWLLDKGYMPVWSSGRKEIALIEAADPEQRFTRYAGVLSSGGLLSLLKNAVFVVCPDTGVAHVAKLVNVPTLILYGPGNPVAFGKGQFWSGNIIISSGFNKIDCRDQQELFSRKVQWLYRCGRNETTCKNFSNGYSACMLSISLDDVKKAVNTLTEIKYYD